MNEQQHKQALPLGYELNGYRVVSVLGVGGFGLTYLAEHVRLGHRVAIKEYLPNEFALREGTTVHAKSEADRDSYEWGLGRFLDEARTLARFEHRNLVRVRDYFEGNATAYIVMDYEEGESLDRLLKRHGTLTGPQLRRVLLPIVDGLREVHMAGFLHRDIKPSNVYVRRSDESPVLLDFGAARQALGRKSRSLTAVASAGYSPPEQYESEGEQGPWTDIYALSALCYRAITGEAPVEAPKRQGRLLRGRPDPLCGLTERAPEGYSTELLEAVDWGLRVIETQRPKNLDEWAATMDGTAVPEPRDAFSLEVTTPQSRVERKSRGSRGWAWAGVATVAVAVAGVAAWWVSTDLGSDGESESNVDTTVVDSSMPAEQPEDGDAEAGVIGGGRAIVVVVTEPAGAQVFIDGEAAGQTPLQLDHVRAGAYNLVLDHPDFERIELAGQSFTDDDPLRIERKLVPATGRLTIMVQPTSAWVENDGERLAENTPVTLDGLPAGMVELTLGAEAYHSASVTANVPRDGVGKLEWTLEPIQLGTLTLELIPSDASVILPDIVPSYRPGLELPEGTYRVRVTRAGYEELMRTVEVAGDTRVRIELARDPYPFTIIPVPQTALIQFVDDTGEYRDGMLLASGTYRVRLSAPGFESVEESVVHELAPTLHTIELNRLPEPLFVTRSPSEASVTILGVSEDYHDGILLPPGMYQVRVSAAGYETIELIVEHGKEPSQVVVALERSTLADSVRSGSRGPEMVVIPAGIFRMGCVSDQQCNDQELPVHEVVIGYAFAISKYEVTFADWQVCLDGGGCNGYSPDDLGWGRDDRPVVNVNWNDAKAYVSWLSRETGEEYRLPSEAEWEYAARAGAATAYTWGDRIEWNRANCRGCRSRWDNEQTAPVGSFPENAFGLHDMHGNVWEWVEDCWNGNYLGAPVDGRPWLSGICQVRLMRGGSWDTVPDILRSENRIGASASFRTDSYGFRVVRTVVP